MEMPRNSLLAEGRSAGYRSHTVYPFRSKVTGFAGSHIQPQVVYEAVEKRGGLNFIPPGGGYC